MKVFFKKFLVCLILFVMLFNFTFTPKVQAATDVIGGLMDGIASVLDGIVGIISWLPRVMALAGFTVLLAIMGTVATSFRICRTRWNMGKKC